ncbi:MAG: cobalamin-dependent protein [Candidatus Latescibacteria bacterium]|nr:cobalamin-dependent protein [Candidatus Latescibacterota bacterium]
MRLLLINTPIERENILGQFNQIYDDLKMVPIGLAYLASVARKNGIEVKILDQYAECISMPSIEKMIKDFSPNLIGFSSTTPNYFAAINMVRHLKRVFPDIKTVMGGQHPSIFPDKVLKNDEVDYVIRDEGEYSLVALCNAIQNSNYNLAHIDGLSYKDSTGKTVHNKQSASVVLDDLPWPAYDLLPMHLYSSPSYTRFALPVYQMSASRGCPNQCTYCINAELNIAAKYRRRNIDDVLDEMEMLVNQYDAKQIQFWDPIFPLGKTYTFEFCEKLIERGLNKKIVWNSTTYAEFLSEELITVMARSGCKGLGFGIESGVPELLKSVNKKVNFNHLREMCRIARKKNIVVAGAFILGFPGETRDMTQQTIDFAKSLDIHYAQFSIMVPYPGTPLYKELHEKGEIVDSGEDDYVRYNQSIGLTDLEPIYISKGRNWEELKAMQKQAYTQFYFRPRLFLMHIPHLRPQLFLRMIKSFLAVVGLLLKKTNKKNNSKL